MDAPHTGPEQVLERIQLGHGHDHALPLLTPPACLLLIHLLESPWDPSAFRGWLGAFYRDGQPSLYLTWTDGPTLLLVRDAHRQPAARTQRRLLPLPSLLTTSIDPASPLEPPAPPMLLQVPRAAAAPSLLPAPRTL